MNKTTSIIIGIVLIIASFYGGMKYDQSKTAATQATRAATFAGGGRGAFGARGSGGFITGQIVSADASSITVALTATSSTATTGSAIVFVSSSTTISKMTTVPASSLTTGENVIITGAKNSDGSINASMIQVRQ